MHAWGHRGIWKSHSAGAIGWADRRGPKQWDKGQQLGQRMAYSGFLSGTLMTSGTCEDSSSKLTLLKNRARPDDSHGAGKITIVSSSAQFF